MSEITRQDLVDCCKQRDDARQTLEGYAMTNRHGLDAERLVDLEVGFKLASDEYAKWDRLYRELLEKYTRQKL